MKTLIRLFAFGFVSFSTTWLLAQSESPQREHGATDSKAQDPHSRTAARCLRCSR